MKTVGWRLTAVLLVLLILVGCESSGEKAFRQLREACEEIHDEALRVKCIAELADETNGIIEP